MNLTEKIKNILNKYPKTRDSDIELYARYLKIELPEEFSTLLVINMLKLIKVGKIYSFDSISRCRRKLQEENKELRGNFYEEKQELANQIKKGKELF